MDDYRPLGSRLARSSIARYAVASAATAPVYPWFTKTGCAEPAVAIYSFPSTASRPVRSCFSAGVTSPSRDTPECWP